MTKVFVLAFALTVEPGVVWQADLKFESQQDCQMIREQIHTIADHRELSFVIEEDCAER
jgi:hypothetical protein